MKFLKKILNATEIVAKEYTVLYYNEDTKGMAFKKGSEPVPPVTPEITITVEDALDTDIIALTATKNETVQGNITWSCNLASDVAEINGATLTFKKHYEGSVVLTATATNASVEKTITVTCDEVATATTYSVKANSVSVAESQPMEASSTSATVNFVGVTTQHYKLKDSVSVESDETQVVAFEANETENPVTRNGSFKWNEQSVEWSVNLKAKEISFEMVDLGLPSGLKWASCNVGATKPEEYGLYFQWGATEGYEYNSAEAKAHSTWETTPFNNGSSSYDSVYFSTVKNTVCPNGVLAPAYDAATVNMGGSWRIPTYADMNELKANTTTTWYANGNTEFNGIAGRKFTSKSDSSKYIFIPATGYCLNGSFSGVGSYGYLWTSSLNSSDPMGARYLKFVSDSVGIYIYNRDYGFSVRAVHE